MRVKITAKILEKLKANKTNYSHETYSMILNNLSSELSAELHKKEKFFRFLTFTNICINKDVAHLYVSGQDELIMNLIQNLQFNEMVRVDDMVLVVKKIELLSHLKKQMDNVYNFKTKFIINSFNKELGKNQLADLEISKSRLIKNSLKKCTELGILGNITDIEIIKPSIVATRYKAGVIKSYRCNLKIVGDYNVVNTIFNTGIGENTASGHGFMWEI